MRQHGAADEHPTSGERGQTAALSLGELPDYQKIPLEDRIALLTGTDTWHTAENPAIGLRPLTVSDGPAGVRGAAMDERVPAASLPCPSALGATWDPQLVAVVAGELAGEARSKGIDVLLGPTINMMRTPLGGRGFECFSEDPLLTALIAAGYVTGLQDGGVAATLKHFVGNDSETGRQHLNVLADERTLRELYLVPFEACVQAGARLVMAGYNRVNGVPMTEHHHLLTTILKDEWGFAGVAVSDWGGARSTLPTALAGLDLVMPGPDGPWGARLAAAVIAGRIAEATVDDKVRRLVGVAARAGADRAGSLTPPAEVPAPLLASPSVLRRAAAASFTLLRNVNEALPLDPTTLGPTTLDPTTLDPTTLGPATLGRAGRRYGVAVIGPNAVRPVSQGGGSAAVPGAPVSVPADAIASALAGYQIPVTVREGCTNWEVVPEPGLGSLTDPETGDPGVRLDVRTCGGTPLVSEHREAAALIWWEPPGGDRTATLTLRARYRPQTTGRYVLAAGGTGQLTLAVDGQEIVTGHAPAADDPVRAMTRPGEFRAVRELAAGTGIDLELTLSAADWGLPPVALRLGIVPEPEEEAMLAAAAAAAAAASAAIVIVGTAPGGEAEGTDRITLALPGRQDELIRRVAAACDRVIVVVNAGMPVLAPWAEQVAAVGYAWLPGQAFGEALADVLLGRAEPGGRLPVTIPRAEADCPVLHAIPEADGTLRYDEGLLVGYRGYDRAGVEPLFPFGHGLGYTTWCYESAEATPSADGSVTVTVTVRNTGYRHGREVVQAYHEPPGSDPADPPRTLAAFTAVTAAPGESVTARLIVPRRAFAHWSERDGGTWILPAGEHVIRIGRSSRDLPLALEVNPAPNSTS
jgi:beta-glucosidase